MEESYTRMTEPVACYEVRVPGELAMHEVPQLEGAHALAQAFNDGIGVKADAPRAESWKRARVFARYTSGRLSVAIPTKAEALAMKARDERERKSKSKAA